MRWFINLKTGNKVLLAFGIVLTLLAIAMATAHQSIRVLQAAQHEIFHVRFANAVDLAALSGDQREARGKVLKVLLTDDPRVQREERAQIAELSRQNDARLEMIIDRNRNNAALHADLLRLRETRQAFTAEREDQIFPLLESGNREAAVQLSLGAQSDRIDAIDSITSTLVEKAEAAAQHAVDEAERNADTAVLIFALSTILALLVGIATAVVLNKAITQPLVHLAALAERVAARDLTAIPETNGRLDEVGVLMNTFGRMVENLRKVTWDIDEGVNILASSSNEILASTTEVASSASETASAISQTTTTVEEVRQTAEASSQKAKNVSENAQRATEVAKRGATAVQHLNTGMDDISAQMGEIAKSITTLSEQSQSIGAIIASVDDIAEQSNLLAVNAAIEAAKANEHGKGFAVVAQEVRNLAEQSKEATKQVRQILNDIQKGVTTAGMFAEQGSKSVSSGIKQAGEAASTIQHMLNTISESSHAAMHIAASSQQQLVGMDQVAQAMESVREASHQNVAAIRQVEEASRSIHELGNKLKKLVSQYKVQV